MKLLVFESFHSPDVLGAPDKYALFSGDGGTLLEHGPARCCPNPHRPPPNESVTWDRAYGWLAPCSCVGVFIRDNQRPAGPCILLAGGKRLPARWPNVNHGGESVIDQVFVHSFYRNPAGSDPGWPGSAGCLTVPSAEMHTIAKHLADGEQVRVVVVDYSQVAT